MSPFPDSSAERTEWIIRQRGAAPQHDVWKAHGAFMEREPLPDGEIAEVTTVLLTSRECPWHCTMCDLWRFTVQEAIPPGAIEHQVRTALAGASHDRSPAPRRSESAPGVRQIKLYNGGSFFDPNAVPPADYPAIARWVAGFDRVIVESHPGLVGSRAVQFQALLAEAADRQRRPRPPGLEVAMGLETVHPEALEKLNKRMTLPQFLAAARFLAEHEIALRAFVLVQPPFQPPAEAADWAQRSVDFAFDCGATATALIPTRPGNGALDALVATGDFTPPSLDTLEDAFDAALDGAAGRVFADLWDLDRFAPCPACRARRRERLERMNLGQAVLPRVECAVCGAGRRLLPRAECEAGSPGP